MQIKHLHRLNYSTFVHKKYITSPGTRIPLSIVVTDLPKHSRWSIRCTSSVTGDNQGQSRGAPEVGTDSSKANEHTAKVEGEDGRDDSHIYSQRKVYDTRLALIRSKLRSKYQIYSGLSESGGGDKSDSGDRHFGISQIQKDVGIEKEASAGVSNELVESADGSPPDQSFDNFFGFQEDEKDETNSQEISASDVNKYLSRRLSRRSSLTREQLVNRYQFIEHKKPKSMEKVLQTNYGQVWLDPKDQQSAKQNQLHVEKKKAEEDTFGNNTGSDFIDNQYFNKSINTIPTKFESESSQGRISVSACSPLHELGKQGYSQSSVENQAKSSTKKWDHSGSDFIDDQYFEYPSQKHHSNVATSQMEHKNDTAPDNTIIIVDNYMGNSNTVKPQSDPKFTPEISNSTGRDFIENQYFEYSSKDHQSNVNAPEVAHKKEPIEEELGFIDNQYFSAEEVKSDPKDFTKNRVSGIQSTDNSDLNYFDEQLLETRVTFPAENMDNKEFHPDTRYEMPVVPPAHRSDIEGKRDEVTEEKPNVHWRMTKQEKRRKRSPMEKENTSEVLKFLLLCSHIISKHLRGNHHIFTMIFPVFIWTINWFKSKHISCVKVVILFTLGTFDVYCILGR